MSILSRSLPVIYVFFLICNVSVFAADKIKFGKVSMEDLQMKSYEKDTTAEAVIISDIGTSSFVWEMNHFRYIFTRHVRIKVLKKDGLSWANGKIPYYETTKSKEDVYGVKGYTFNLENGKIVKEKLSRDAKFVEEKDENWRTVNFTMPNVKEGSVIDIVYNIKSDFLFNFREWYFQYEIPVMHSEYETRVPEYFRYKILNKGYHPVKLVNDGTEAGKITITSKSRSGDLVTQSKIENQDVRFVTMVKKWEATDVPAFRDEPYMTTRLNYLSSVEFELGSISMRQWNVYENYTKDWNNITEELLKDENFGLQLNRGGFLKDVAENIISANSSDMEKMIASYEHIKSNVKWNKRKRLYTNFSLKYAYDNHSGNSADINLMLTLLLRKVGLNAEPVIISTRDHGMIHPAQIMISRFNYVLASVKIGDLVFLLDATEPNCPYYLLPERCVNGQGRIISENNPGWIDLNTNIKHVYSSTADLSLNEEGNLEGEMSCKRENYSALDFRKEVEEEGSLEDYIKSFDEKNEKITIKEFQIKGLDSIYNPIVEKYKIVYTDCAEDVVHLIYLNPLLEERMEKNIFKLQDRKFPVDYTHPYEKTYVLNLRLPEGYSVDEVPSSINLNLPENKASFSYLSSVSEGLIQIKTEFKINKSVFVPSEYEELKKFYDEIVAKQAEQVVLKKI